MSSAPKAPTRRPYPHFDDLVQEINIDAQKHASIKKWIEEAQSHWKNFLFQEELGRVDGAYLDFMKAAEIVFHVIPAQKEYPTFKSKLENTAHRDYINLQKNIEQQFGKAETLRSEIKKDNERHDTKRKYKAQQQTRPSTPGTHVNGTGVSKSNTPSQKKPPPVPAKPSSVSGQHSTIDGKQNGYTQKSITKPIGSDGNIPSADDLSARFDRLRSSNSLSRLPSDTNGSLSPKSSILSSTSGGTGSRGRPPAHRELPISPRLDTSVITGLPRPPSPTYSPARNSISPARSIPRKPISTSPAINLTNETTLSPAALSTYISRSTEISLLVLDVRERTDYDEGHIPAKAIICIEPLQLLREGITGDDLEDSISLSPSPKEHELFSKRHTYDLVVYHDQSTASDSFLNQRSNDQQLVTLRRLHQALCDFSYQKPLKRPPVLLLGGLKAWVDLFGPSSLVFGYSRPNSPPSSHKSSAVGLGISTMSRATPALPDTVNQPNSKEQPQGKIGDTNNAFHIDIAEEKAWLQKLQGDREPLTISVPIDAENMDVKRQRRSTSIVAASETFPRTIEQFFQQFPASPSTQSMMSPIPGTPALATPLTPASKKYTIIDHPFYGFTDVRNPDFHPPPSPVRPPPALPRKSYKGESEKPPFRPIDPPIVVEKSSMVGFTEHTLASPTRLHNFATVGLQNVQNCCYMNAVIQCISGSIPLARYFLDGSYKMHIARSSKTRGQFVELLASLVKNLWAGRYKFISPKSFKEYCGTIRDEFGGNLQNDAQEFLDFLMNSLHDDLNPNASRSELQELTPEQEEYRETLPIPYASHLEWQRYIHRNYSVVINWFQGQYFSRLVCQVCNFQSTTYAPFFTLTLNLPPGKKHPTIYECITHYLCQEVHETVDWKCTKCKVNRPTKKTLGLTRLPHMLVIHLSRFKYSNGPLGPMDVQKISLPVQYPLRGLQLDKYVPQIGDGKYGGPPGVAPKFQPAPEQTAPFVYDLYGVVKHYGTSEGGHYTCLLKDSWAEQWKYFDDTSVRVVDEEEVQSRDTQTKAYMLFWVRKNIM